MNRLSVSKTTGWLTRWRFGDPVAPLREHLSRGGLAAIPSESSYGLACDPRSPAGVEAIYRLKERDRGKPLPVVAADATQLSHLEIDPAAPAVRLVAESIWPDALSLVLPTRDGRSWPAAGGGATLAVRVPAHARLRELLADVGFPLTATSANSAGEAPILDPNELMGWLETAESQGLLKDRVFLIDDGPLPGGSPSTLVVATDSGWHLIRPGRVELSRLPRLPSPD